jgi:hypothetical protein
LLDRAENELHAQIYENLIEQYHNPVAAAISAIWGCDKLWIFFASTP